jgi:hypothetical protein
LGATAREDVFQQVDGSNPKANPNSTITNPGWTCHEPAKDHQQGDGQRNPYRTSQIVHRLLSPQLIR